MRPKKRILLIDRNEERLGLRRFLLENKGFRVFSAENAETARKSFRNDDVDMVLLCALSADRKCFEGALRHMKKDRYYIPVLIALEDAHAIPVDTNADYVLLAPLCTSAQIVESCRLFCARKRGPRPGTPAPRKPPQSVRPEEAAVRGATA